MSEVFGAGRCGATLEDRQPDGNGGGGNITTHVCKKPVAHDGPHGDGDRLWFNGGPSWPDRKGVML